MKQLRFLAPFGLALAFWLVVLAVIYVGSCQRERGLAPRLVDQVKTNWPAGTNDKPVVGEAGP